MQRTGCSFQVALAVTRAGNLFTTHTPVAAGFDAFAPGLMQRYFDGYAQDRLGIRMADLMALGRRNPADDGEPFSMAYLAVRGSGAVNGVSRLHGDVSRSIFEGLFPRWPRHEVPVGHVTNGVHVDTWSANASESVWTKYGGPQRWAGETEALEAALRQVPDKDLWAMRQAARRALVTPTRERYVRQSAMWGAGPEEMVRAKQILDPEALTLGFARRFATYKRPTLLLQDPERLLRMLDNSRQPVQLIVAGKAHPADRAGQAMIRQWIDFSRRPEVAGRVVFLSDYDMLLTEQLVGGVDVWINTPRRPFEACGTSGMKVLANGGLNLSELDGWWVEAYTPEVGWAMGDGKERGEDPAWDAIEADGLYTLLEQEVIPLFYRRIRDGIPEKWLNKVRESMATLTPRFSSNRAVREYTESYYLPAAEAFRRRSADGGEVGRRLAAWQDGIRRKWPDVRFGDSDIRSDKDFHTFRVRVFAGGFVPEAIAVQLYAEPLADGEQTVWPMTREASPEQADWGVYEAKVPARRLASVFTARIIPNHPDAVIPLETAFICWQH